MAIEHRAAESQYDRLPALAAALVRRRIAVIVPVGTPAALAARAATRDQVKAMFTNPRPHDQFLVCNECISEMHQRCNEIIAQKRNG